MIGSLITKKCTKALITAPTSQISRESDDPGIVVNCHRSQVTGHRSEVTVLVKCQCVRVICLPHSVKRQCDSHLATGKLCQSSRGLQRQYLPLSIRRCRST